MAETKRVVVAGATGEIGQVLSRSLMESGYSLIIFTRNPQTARKRVPGASKYVAWNPAEGRAEIDDIDGAYGVIDLAGAPFFTRWSDNYRQVVQESRSLGIHSLLDAMAKAEVKPRVFIYGSSVGTYGYEDADKQKTLDENSPIGQDFWGQDSVALEQEAEQAEALGIRAVTVRTGIVLDKEGGVLKQQVPQFRRFMGGPTLPGDQWFPWVHIDDVVGIIRFALENDGVRGPINATGPDSQTNRDFMKTLGKVLHRPSWLSMPAFLLKLFLGKVSTTIIHGRRVVPKKALASGYHFKYATSEQALRQILLS